MYYLLQKNLRKAQISKGHDSEDRKLDVTRHEFDSEEYNRARTFSKLDQNQRDYFAGSQKMGDAIMSDQNQRDAFVALQNMDGVETRDMNLNMQANESIKSQMQSSL
jgi:hypothetical protein